MIIKKQTGENYNKNLTAKDIARLVRKFLKETYPTYKFSVRTKNIDSLRVEMLESPIEICKNFEELNDWDFETISKKIKDGISFLAMTKEEKKKHLTNDDGRVVTFLLNDETKKVIEDVNRYVYSYLRDDSDVMRDCFDRNFNFAGCEYRETKVTDKQTNTVNNEIEKEEKQTNNNEIKKEKNTNNVTDYVFEKKYYEIDENNAKLAKRYNSFYDYKDGEATKEYIEQCNAVYDVLEDIKNENPQNFEKAKKLVDQYCKKLAKFYNDYYKNNANCPSVMIAGAGHFPNRKKQKQIEKWAKIWEYYDKVKEIKENIELLKEVQEIVERNGKTIYINSEKCEVVEDRFVMKLLLFFDKKPSLETRRILKQNSFRWNPVESAWFKKLNRNTIKTIENIASM